MKATAVGIMLLVALANATAQNVEPDHSISVTLSIDGKEVPCVGLKVELNIGQLQIVPEVSGQRFIVPDLIDKLYASVPTRQSNDIDVSAACGEYTFKFAQLYPIRVKPGYWELGIAHPPFWFEKFRGTQAMEHGAWISYLETDCYDCDPGLISWTQQTDPPPSLMASLLQEQPTASGEAARDTAYALAVFNAEYKKNREYLLNFLTSCTSGPETFPQPDGCDDKLLDELTNLYWRGDDGLLDPLLESDPHKDVLLEISYFYVALLDRRPEAILKELQLLPIEKQGTVCNLAGNEFSVGNPQFDRITQHLRSAEGKAAQQCLREMQKAIRPVPPRL